MVAEWLLVFARVGAAVAFHPVFGGNAVPRTVVVGVAAALASAVFAAVAGAHVDAPAGTVAYGVALGREAALGATIGLVGRAIFGAVEAVGRLVDDARGASTAQVFAPHTGSFASPLGALELQLSIAVFWAMGAHAALIVSFVESYSIVPATLGASGSVSDSSGLEILTDAAGALCRAALAMAGPAVVAATVVDILFGLVGRGAPQVNVSFLGLPTKLLVAVLVTAASASDRAAIWTDLWSLERSWARDALSRLAANGG